MRKFHPTFVVTVVPSEVAAGETSTGKPYASMKDATVRQEGRRDVTRTIMAFGPSASALAESLAPGRPVRLAVQYDGATLRLVGVPADKAM